MQKNDNAPKVPGVKLDPKSKLTAPDQPRLMIFMPGMHQGNKPKFGCGTNGMPVKDAPKLR